VDYEEDFGSGGGGSPVALGGSEEFEGFPLGLEAVEGNLGLPRINHGK